MEDATGGRDRRPDHLGDTLVIAARARRPAAWATLVWLAAFAALMRGAAGQAPWVPLFDATWGVLCVAAISIGIQRRSGHGRAAWWLFSASILCGTAAMTLYPWAGGASDLGRLRDVLDVGAYLFGAAGIAVLIRRFGGADPDAWLDAAAIGVALSLVMFEVLRGAGGPVAQAGQSIMFPALVTAVDAAIFTTLARFVIRPIGSPSLSGLGAIIGVVLVLDAGYYAGVGMDRAVYGALWILAYGAWAASSLHPDTTRLVLASHRPRETLDAAVRGAFTSIVIHSIGFSTTVVVFWVHSVRNPGPDSTVFLVGFALQIVLVCGRSVRLVGRLREDDRRRREAETALRASEERFRSLAEVAPVGIFLSDAEGHSLFQNSRWAQAAGMAPTEAHQWSLAKATHPDDRDRAMEAWLEAVRTLQPFDIEHRLLRPDGSVRWVHSSAAPLMDPTGQLDGWVGTVADITSLVETRTAAQERERFVGNLIEQAPVGIGIYAPDGHAIGANLAQRRIRELAAPGEPAADDVRRDPLMLRLGQGRAIGDAFAGRAGGDADPIRVAIDPAGDSGPDLWLRMTWFPLREPDRRITAVISFAEDVTPAARAEAARRAVEGKLRETAKLEALGVLAGGIAHDFNNLLVAILGHASLARTQVGADSPVDEDLASVEMAARRAADLARQMLAYSGRGSFVVGPQSIEGLLREMSDLLARSIAKGATLRHEFTPGLPPVLADATQIRQVALNLIVNASDALGDQPGTITLRTGLVTLAEDDPDLVPGVPASPGTYVVLEVADTGRGMDLATRARIFDPFFTTKATGRGLGLAATLGIVKGHGGALRVTSHPGRGTRFEVLLRPADVAAPEPETRAPTPELPTAGPGRAGRILIVDDEPSVRALGRRVLERAGYAVEEAPDGPEGIQVFASDPARWTAVLLDLTLPTLDGMAVLGTMRELRPGIPAVICSGWAAEEVTERIAATPGTRVVEKPYAPAALVNAFATLAETPWVTGRGSVAG